MPITAQFLDFVLTSFFLILFVSSIIVLILRLINPELLPKRETLAYEARERGSKLKNAILMRKLDDPTTYTLYDSIWYSKDK